MNKHDFDKRKGLLPFRPPVFTKPDTRERSGVEVMIDELRTSGQLRQEEWADALRDVPRHLFVPDRAWVRPPDGSHGHVIDRGRDPQGWMTAVYSGQVIATQLNDGAGELSSGEGQLTSSLSRMASVLNMLQRLNPYPGGRVLEIGTGVGYTTGLLCHRLGERNVTSIEVDEALSKRATVNLQSLGLFPRLVVGDGAHGFPADAPYDRVHVTCGVTTIPHAWVEQTRPGGVIVVPWMSDWIGGHTITLTVRRDQTAIGRLVDSTEYMMMRSQRPQPADLTSLNEHGRQTEASVDPRGIVFAGWGADVAIAALLPDVSATYETPDYGRHFQLMAWTSDSRLTVSCAPDLPRPLVRQDGPRDLWQEIQEAFFTWIDCGEPARDRFGVTITPDGMTTWLDRPDRVLSPLTCAHATSSRK